MKTHTRTIMLRLSSSFTYYLQPEKRVVRRTIARYCILCSVLAWRSISLRVLERYPTDSHLLKSGLITPEELQILNAVQIKIDPHRVCYFFFHFRILTALNKTALGRTDGNMPLTRMPLCHMPPTRDKSQSFQNFRANFTCANHHNDWPFRSWVLGRFPFYENAK